MLSAPLRLESGVPQMSKQRKRVILAWCLVTPAVLLKVLTAVYPFFTTLFYSFFDYSALSKTRDFIGVKNYISMWRDTTFTSSILFTGIFTVGSMALHVVFGLMLALLLNQKFRFKKPLRSIGIRGTDLIPIDSVRQISIFDDEAKRERMEKLEYAIDDIRRRFGHHSIGRALLTMDDKLGKLNPKADHTIHPIGYL